MSLFNKQQLLDLGHCEKCLIYVGAAEFEIQWQQGVTVSEREGGETEREQSAEDVAAAAVVDPALYRRICPAGH